jgi:fructose-1,6-bisphosphatase/inositol monophosphatase family enzyme
MAPHSYHQNIDVDNRIWAIVSILPHIQKMMLRTFTSNELSPSSKTTALNTIALNGATEVIEQYLISQIKSLYPDDRILSPILGIQSGSSPFTWTLNPINSFLCFSRKIPFFSACIGLLFDQEPTFGLLLFPLLDEYIFAADGHTPTWKPSYTKTTQICSVRLAAPVSEPRILAFSDPKFFSQGPWPQRWKHLNQFEHARGWGDSYGALLLATGRIDLLIEPEGFLKLWDIVPLIPLLKGSKGHIKLLPLGCELYMATGYIAHAQSVDEPTIQAILK